MQIIDGKAVATKVRGDLKEEVALLKAETGKEIGLAVVLVGDDNASRIYVRNKINACGEIGINSTLVELPSTATEREVLEAVATLNDDKNIHGIIAVALSCLNL